MTLALSTAVQIQALWGNIKPIKGGESPMPVGCTLNMPGSQTERFSLKIRWLSSDLWCWIPSRSFFIRHIALLSIFMLAQSSKWYMLGHGEIMVNVEPSSLRWCANVCMDSMNLDISAYFWLPTCKISVNSLSYTEVSLDYQLAYLLAGV